MELLKIIFENEMYDIKKYMSKENLGENEIDIILENKKVYILQKQKIKIKLRKFLEMLGINDEEEKDRKERLAKILLAEMPTVHFTRDFIWLYSHSTQVNSGTLKSSCMRGSRFVRTYERIQEVFAAYTLNENGLINARCLLWYLGKGEVYADRIYAADAMSQYMLEKYLKTFCSAFYKEKGEMSTGKYYRFRVLEPFKSEHYEDSFPCLDTFQYLKIIDKKLYVSNKSKDALAITHVSGILHDVKKELAEYFDEHGILYYATCPYCMETCLSNEIEDGRCTYCDGAVKCSVCNCLEYDPYWHDNEPYCTSCAEKYLAVCDYCDAIIHKHDAEEIDGRVYCNNCFEECIVECFECGKMFDYREAEYINDHPYCEECAAITTTMCENCGNEIYATGAYYLDNHPYCTDCYEQLQSEE